MTPSHEETAPPAGLKASQLPRHVAIIMDGNGRWAKKKGWRRVRGHEEGAESVRVIVRACRRWGVKALTLYAFSNENWARPKAEVGALMRLLERYLDSEREEMRERGIRLNLIGEIERLPEGTRRSLDETMAYTAEGQDMVLTLSLSYGGRQEILSAVKALCRQAAAGEIDPESIDEEVFSARLFTAGLPDPDLLIRTSGELRTSNFLPWQLVYSEFYFTDTLWPDFREKEFLAAIQEYARRQRRFGKTGEQVKGRG